MLNRVAKLVPQSRIGPVCASLQDGAVAQPTAAVVAEILFEFSDVRPKLSNVDTEPLPPLSNRLLSALS